jgi:hypothetical protein
VLHTPFLQSVLIFVYHFAGVEPSDLGELVPDTSHQLGQFSLSSVFINIVAFASAQFKTKDTFLHSTPVIVGAGHVAFTQVPLCKVDVSHVRVHPDPIVSQSVSQ